MEKGDVILTHRFYEGVKIPVLYLIEKFDGSYYHCRRIDRDDDFNYHVNYEIVLKRDFGRGVSLHQQSIATVKRLQSALDKFHHGERDEKI